MRAQALGQLAVDLDELTLAANAGARAVHALDAEADAARVDPERPPLAERHAATAATERQLELSASHRTASVHERMVDPAAIAHERAEGAAALGVRRVPVPRVPVCEVRVQESTERRLERCRQVRRQERRRRRELRVHR